MGLPVKLLVGGVAAGAALAYYVARRHEASGESYLRIIAELPNAARQSLADVKRRARLALEDGQAAARSRERELMSRLGAAGSMGETGHFPYPGP